MNPIQIEPLEPRTLLSQSPLLAPTAQAQTPTNSLTAKTLPNTFDDSDPEETFYFSNVHLTWTRASTSPIDGYHLFASTNNGSTYTQIATTTANSYTAANLLTGTKYLFKVRPFTTTTGNQSSLGTASAVTILQSPFTTVFDPTSDGTVSLSFRNQEDVATAFRVRWAPTNNPTQGHSRVITAQEDTDGRVSYVDGTTKITGLDPATTYDFQVTALDDVTTSAPFEQSIAPIAVPANLQAHPQTDESMQLTWTNMSSSETGFKIEWGTDASGKYDHSMTAGTYTKKITIDEYLQDNTDYLFRVIALNGSTESQPSNIVEAQAVSPFDTDFQNNGPVFQDGDHPVKTDIRKNSKDAASDVAIQPDGKVIVVGTSNHNFEIVRYNTDGSLDNTFGSGGKVSLDFGGNDAAHSVSLNGYEIYVAGTSNTNGVVAVLNNDGSLFQDFGTGGKLEIFTTAQLDAWNIATDSNGDFDLAGIVDLSGQRTAQLFNYNFPGNLNTDWINANIPNVTGKHTAMLVQPDGKVLLACKTQSDIAIARFKSNGQRDTHFGKKGIQTIQLGDSTTAEDVYGLALQPNGDILLCGTALSASASAFTIARLTSTGSLDPTFAQSGIALLNIGSKAAAHAITVLPTGQIVAVGTVRGNFAVIRLTADGAQDKDFDIDGIATTDIGSPTDTANALALAKDGTLYAAGASGDDFAAVHYFVSPVNTPTNFLALPAYEAEEFDIIWTDASRDQTSDVLERSLSPHGPWQTVFSTGPNVGVYDDPNIVAGTEYYYRLIAFRGPLQSIAATTHITAP